MPDRPRRGWVFIVEVLPVITGIISAMSRGKAGQLAATTKLGTSSLSWRGESRTPRTRSGALGARRPGFARIIRGHLPTHDPDREATVRFSGASRQDLGPILQTVNQTPEATDAEDAVCTAPDHSHAVREQEHLVKTHFAVIEGWLEVLTDDSLDDAHRQRASRVLLERTQSLRHDVTSLLRSLRDCPRSSCADLSQGRLSA